jgi:hypothetical protein
MVSCPHGTEEGVKQYSEKELVEEIAGRHADKNFREGMTMLEMEVSVEELKAGTGEPSIALMLKPERPTARPAQSVAGGSR